MKRGLHGWLVLLFAVMWGGSMLVPASAYAHARLLGSSPAPGASLEASPEHIEISLSEAVSLDFSSIVLLDRSRRELPLASVAYGAQGESSVSAAVESSLPPGTYGVIWRVVSAIDGHLTTGSFVFRVLSAGESITMPPEPVLGITGAGQTELGTAAQSPSPVHWLVRALVLACITFCLGGAIFLVLVVEPAIGELVPVRRDLWLDLGSSFAGAGAIAAAALVPLLALDLWAQVAAISMTDMPGALGEPDLVSLLLSSTRYGFAWTMKMLGAVVLFGLFTFIWVGRRGGGGLWEIGIAAGSLFLLAEALSSHAAAVQGENVAGLPLPVISDWVHLVTASTWIGGLLFFTVVLFPAYRRLLVAPDERRGFLATAVPRFSRLALASVLALGVSGTYNLAIQTTDLSAIATSLYGQVVGLKVLLFGALILIGAINFAYLTPRLRGGSSVEGAGTLSKFRRNVRLEMALMVVVLLCAGGLTLLPPPSPVTLVAAEADASRAGLTLPTATVQNTSPTAANTMLPVSAATSVPGTAFVLGVGQEDAGEVFTLTLATGASGQAALTDVTRLVLTVAPQDVEAGSTVLQVERVAQEAGDVQVWVARASVLAFQGDYLITAVAQRTTSRDLKTAFWLSLGESGAMTLRAIRYLEARFTTAPEPPVRGRNFITVEMRDAEGALVRGVGMKLSASGPGGRQLVTESVPVIPAAQPGQYTTEVEFSVGGPWVLQVTATRDGQPELKFTASIDVVDAPTP
ncbi:MAG: CopD family protein [Chloroflexota bacterium]|nr:CopD family protein [Chloroflexota bacterium]MDQ5864150.1 CopD family protein [Chloroflexota bacterium]